MMFIFNIVLLCQLGFVYSQEDIRHEQVNVDPERVILTQVDTLVRSVGLFFKLAQTFPTINSFDNPDASLTMLSDVSSQTHDDVIITHLINLPVG